MRITDGGAATFLPADGWAWFHIDNGPTGGRPTGRLRISYGVNPGDFEVVSVAQVGNVGIGNPNPAQTLDVAGNVQAADFLIPSDERLKTNINQLSGSLDSLDAVRGVSFEWSETAEQTGHANGRRQIGVIAQELAAVHPELVFTPTVMKNG